VTPQRTIGHYRIVAKLGEGGMGEVWRATDTKLGRDVAIKVLPDAFAQDADRMMRFTREAQVLASLNHPHIAAIYGVEERALVMELVDGPTLAERIRQGPIPLSEALPIAKEIAMALEYAHEKSIIHRDLKPANVKLTAEGRAKVLDFGLAKALSNDPAPGDPASSPTLTMRATLAGVILGTAAYMSPEQARGAAADRRSDIWSFGVMLYEMLTGRQIFGGETVSDSLAAVLKTEPDWSALPHGTPAAIRRLLRRALERDRKRRLPDIADARLEIDEALSAPTEAAAPQAAPPPARRAFGWLNTAVAVAALIGLAALAFVPFRETAPLRPIRFQIPPPEDASFEVYGMALSPDGRRLAFIASNAVGHSMLWLRSLDTVVAQPVPGTDGAMFLPFWSPDSRSIAFSVASKLKRVEAAGGPAQTLCEINGTIAGGSWSREGFILFGTPTGGLFRVSQAGGVPALLTKVDSSQEEMAHMRPWFLPDGRHFLYFSRNQKPEASAIYLGSLDGKQRKRLVLARQAAAYAPPGPGAGHGQILFLRENTLMAQPLDVQRGEIAGEPVPIAEPVGSQLALGFYSVSANGVLAYRAGPSLVNASQLIWYDRTGKPLSAVTPSGSYSSVALSRDQRRVAVDQVDQGNRDIWTMEAARGIPARFTFDAAVDMLPIWSPDGNRLVFASDRTGRYAVYQKDSRGAGTEQQLLKAGLPYGWSADGRQLVFGKALPNTRTDLWVATFDKETVKEEPYLQSQYDERQGQFSPDGRFIAYISDESSNQFHVYVQSFPAGRGKFQVSAGPGVQPRWRPDGKELFYVSMEGTLMAVEVKTSPGFEVGAPKPLFPARVAALGTGYFSFNYDVAADGKRFLVNSYATKAETSPLAPITVVVNWQSALR